MSCKSRTSQFFLALGIVMMWNMYPQSDCTVPMNRWVVVMWLLMTSKYLTLEEDVRENPMRLFCGASMINPLMFFWILKGIAYLSWAEGKTCFIGTSFSMVVFQIVVASTSILYFIVGFIIIILFCILRALHWITKYTLGQERANRIPFFRIFAFLQSPHRVPSLNVSQIDQLKAKIGRVVTDEEAASQDFMENPCPICWSQLEVGQEYLKMKCKHHYHASCLEEWLKKKSSCPMCNAEIKVSDYDDVASGSDGTAQSAETQPNVLITETGSSETTHIEMAGNEPAGGHDGGPDSSRPSGWGQVPQHITGPQSMELSQDPDHSMVGLTAHEA